MADSEIEYKAGDRVRERIMVPGPWAGSTTVFAYPGEILTQARVSRLAEHVAFGASVRVPGQPLTDEAIAEAAAVAEAAEAAAAAEAEGEAAEAEAAALEAEAIAAAEAAAAAKKVPTKATAKKAAAKKAAAPGKKIV